MAEVQVRPRAGGLRIGPWRRWLSLGARGRAAAGSGASLDWVREVGELERAYARLSDDELRERGARYRRAVRVGTPVAELRNDLLAVLRELGRRELGVRASDATLAAACAAHSGAWVELAPGEGKSLAAIFAVALAALDGQGAHLLAANSYLARRGARRAAPLLEALGLRVGSLETGSQGEERHKLYAADVLFTTADEIARDALLDFATTDAGQPVQARLARAIADDVDGLWLEPVGARWIVRESTRAGAPILAALLRAQVPGLYASCGGLSSVAAGLAERVGAGAAVEIPGASAMNRLDHPDALFTHAAARDRAVTEATARAHLENRPVLLVAADAAQAARLGEMLRVAGVRCNLLEEHPGEVNGAVLERAGAPGAVTVAIRGVDRGIAIPLGRGVAALGGLCTIALSRPGVELADRIVRGLAGQRGAPGATRFFLALDDAATFGPAALERLSRRWRELRSPGPIGDPVCLRDLRELLAEREEERRAVLASLARDGAVLLAQLRIAATRRFALREGGAVVVRAWSKHVARTDQARVERALRGRGSDGFAGAARESFVSFLADVECGLTRDGGAPPARPAEPELEIDPGLRV